MNKMLRWVTIGLLMGLCGLMLVCGYWYWYGRFFTNKELEALAQVDQIKITVSEVQGHGGEAAKILSLKIIDNPQEIERIVAKLRTCSNHWQYESFGPPDTGVLGRPVPIGVTFYDKGEIKTILRIGYSKDMPYFLTRYQEGRYLSYEEFKEIMVLLGLDEQAAYY